MDTRLGVQIDPTGAEQGGRRVRDELDKMKRGATDTFAAGEKGAHLFGEAMRELGAIIGVVSFAKFLHDSVEAASEYEEALAQLAVQTGSTGKALREYQRTAEEVSAGTIFSAKQILGAFETLEDVRPDVFASQESLRALTSDTVALTEALGGNLSQNILTVGTLLNQFDLEATDSNRVVNLLASGMASFAGDGLKFGDALKTVGALAGSANLKLEETAAALILLTREGVDGAEAGQQLGLVLNRLATEIPRFNPEVVGMARAFENLSQANLTTTQILDMFGARARKVAEILMGQSDQISVVQGNITGLNNVYRIAAERTNTLKGDTDRFKRAMEELGTAVGGEISPLVREVTEALTHQMEAWVNTGEAARVTGGIVQGLVSVFGDIAFAVNQAKTAVKEFAATFEGNVAAQGLSNIIDSLKFLWQEFVTLGPTNFKFGTELMLAQLDVFFTKAESMTHAFWSAQAQNIMDLLQPIWVGVETIAMNTPQLLPGGLKDAIEGIADIINELGGALVKYKGTIDGETAAFDEQLVTKNKTLQTTIDIYNAERNRLLTAREQGAVEDANRVNSFRGGPFQGPPDDGVRNGLQSQSDALNLALAATVNITRTQNKTMAESIMEDYQLIEDAALGAFKDIKSSMVDLAMEGQLTFATMATSILQSIERVVLNNMFTQLFSMIAGALFPGTAALTSPGQIDPSFLPPGGISGLVNAGGHQFGGSFNVPGSGPPDSKLMVARVTPGERVAFGDSAGGGGGTVVQVINATGQNVSQRTTRQADGRDLVRIIIGEVSQSILRGGQINKAMQFAFSGMKRATDAR